MPQGPKIPGKVDPQSTLRQLSNLIQSGLMLFPEQLVLQSDKEKINQAQMNREMLLEALSNLLGRRF